MIIENIAMQKKNKNKKTVKEGRVVLFPPWKDNKNHDNIFGYSDRQDFICRTFDLEKVLNIVNFSDAPTLG